MCWAGEQRHITHTDGTPQGEGGIERVEGKREGERERDGGEEGLRQTAREREDEGRERERGNREREGER